MLKRLRKNHPLWYCVLAEVLFLASLTLASFLLMFLLMAVGADLEYADEYALTIFQELAGIAMAVLFLKKTDRATILRRRGCGFLDGLLVGMYPLVIIAEGVGSELLYDRPDTPMLPAWRVVCFFAGMGMVGIAEELLFRGVVAQTLLEHYGFGRAGVWKACLVSGLLFGAAHLTNLTASALTGVLMQCVFAASLGILLAAIYFRTGNVWVVSFLHAAMDIASMLIGGLYGTETVADSINGYDASLLLSVVIYILPVFFLLRKKKIGEVALYCGRGCEKVEKIKE